MTASRAAHTISLRALAHPVALRQSALFCLTWIGTTLLVATLEATADPLTAWERLLGIVFGLLIPGLAFTATLAMYRLLANPLEPAALSARHGANRRHGLSISVASTMAQAILVTCAAIVVSRVACHGATESIWNHDLALCCGIGCLATATYIAYFFAATRLGFGRAGAWVAFGVDLTLGHIDAGWAFLLPHRHVVNLIGHPGVFAISARASSWVLVGIFLLGLTFASARTPR